VPAATLEPTAPGPIPPHRSVAELPERLAPPMPSHGWRGWVGPLAVGALAAVTRITNLGRPDAVVFDETYYAKDAWSYLRFGVEIDEVENHKDLMLQAGDNWRTVEAFSGEPGFIVHPPVGKWTIAVGEYIFGVDPFGWRIAVAILGVLAVIITARIVRRLTRSDVLGTIAGLLLALEGIHIVMSRTALLDLTLGFWVLVGFGLLLIDRDRTRQRVAQDIRIRGVDQVANGLGPYLGLRPWRIAAIAAFGLAIGTKWSGLYFLAAFMVMSLIWDALLRRAIGVDHPWSSAFARDLPLAALSTIVIGIGVYLLTWTGWFATSTGWSRNWAADQGPSIVPDPIRSLWHYHSEMWNFHTNLDAEHNYASNPLSWPFMTRPTSFYYETPEGCGADSCSSTVLAVGNPIIWWAALLAIPYQLWRWIAARDWRSGAVLVGIAAGWLPWMLYLDRTIFTFYTVVYVPFVVMAVTLTLGSIARGLRNKPRWIPAAIIGSYLFAVVLAAWWFYPIWTAELIPYESWRMRMWLPTWI
jgi:dolichyl-phosphate-mannose-protein mannosyltransferase